MHRRKNIFRHYITLHLRQIYQAAALNKISKIFSMLTFKTRCFRLLMSFMLFNTKLDKIPYVLPGMVQNKLY